MMVDIANGAFEDLEKTSSISKLETNKINGDIYGMFLHFASNVIISGFLGLDSLKMDYKGQTLAKALLQLS